MTTSYRIIAADSFHLVPNIVRAATDLLERFATIIEVRSGTEALAELQRGDVNMLVTGYALDDMRAFELALKAEELNPGLPVIILASADDPVMDEETLAASPFSYLVRASEGERFVLVLRALLDGEEPPTTQAEVVAVNSGPNLGPVPKVDIAALADTLSRVLTDVGAMAVVMVDRQGTILQEMGAVGYLDREQLTSIMAQNFGNMVSIGSLVGGEKPRAMHFYDGKDFDIFALAVGLHHFICLIFEGEAGARAFGPVNMYGRRAVQEMVDIIGEVAYQYELIEAPAPVESKPTKEKATSKKKAKPAKEKAAPPPPKASTPEEEYTPPRPPALEPLPDDADLESMLAGLDGLNLADADDLFDPDKLAEIAAEKMAGERLTYEEAQQMGVLQK